MEKQEILQSIKKKESKKENLKIHLTKKEAMLLFLRYGAFLLFGFLLGSTELMFDTYPLGFALLSSSNGEAPFVLLGLIASAFNGGKFSLPIVSGACLITAARVTSSLFLDKKKENVRSHTAHLNALDQLFAESTSLRVMSNAIGVFLIGVLRIAVGGFRFYDLFGSIFYLILSPIATLLFTEYFNISYQRKAQGRAFSISASREKFYHLSCLILFCALTLSLSQMTFMGISIPLFLALFLTMYASKKGFIYGIVSGLLLGLSVSPEYAPMLAFCILSYMSVSKLSLLGGSIASCISGLMFALYVHGVSSLASDLPALLSASLTFFAAERFDVFEDVKAFIKSEKQSKTDFCEDLIIAEQKMNFRDERLRSISDSFSSLSEIFYNLSSRLKRPTMLDLHSICEKSFEKYCDACDRRESCFGAEYPFTLDAIKKSATQLYSFGIADEKKLPDSFKKNCPRVNDIIKEVNLACSIATKKAFQNEKTEIFALDYDAISSILNDAISENENEFKTDIKMGKKISRAIVEAGYGEHSVMVFGKRKLKIIARDLDLTKASGNITKLVSSLESITQVRLCEPTFELSFGSVNMQIDSQRAFSAECAFANSASSKERVCGDTVSIFENKNDYLYALISDGMGTGNKAAIASELCNVFLRNMLSAGNKMETSLRMLNSVLRNKGNKSEDECSATIDLLQFDLYSGALTLVKSGAAPTFVLRRGNVFKLASSSFPIGILRSTDAKELSISCEDGDIIVMVSDGTLIDGDNCDYLSEFLREKCIYDDPAQKIADRIMRRAKSESDTNNLDDDISIIVLKIRKDICNW